MESPGHGASFRLKARVVDFWAGLGIAGRFILPLLPVLFLAAVAQVSIARMGFNFFRDDVIPEHSELAEFRVSLSELRNVYGMGSGLGEDDGGLEADFLPGEEQVLASLEKLAQIVAEEEEEAAAIREISYRVDEIRETGSQYLLASHLLGERVAGLEALEEKGRDLQASGELPEPVNGWFWPLLAELREFSVDPDEGSWEEIREAMEGSEGFLLAGEGKYLHALVEDLSGSASGVLQDMEEREALSAHLAELNTGIELAVEDFVADLNGEATEAAERGAVLSMLSVLFSMGLMTFVLIWSARTAAGSLQSLRSAAVSFGVGNRDIRIRTTGPAEVNKLGDAFNQMVAEITDSETKLKEGKRFTEEILASMTDLLLVVDSDGMVLSSNRAVQEIAGLSSGEVEGQPIQDFLEVSEPHGSPFPQGILDGARVAGMEMRFRPGKDEGVPVSVDSVGLSGAGGSVGVVVLVARDMTETMARIAVETEKAQELAVAFDQLERAHLKLEVAQVDLLNASREAGRAEVANGVLHNIGNVLNSVNTSSGVLKEKLRNSPVSGLKKVATALRSLHSSNGPAEEGGSRTGKLADYLDELGSVVGSTEEAMVHELGRLEKNIEHMNTILAAQQRYASAHQMTDTCSLLDLINDALDVEKGRMEANGVEVIKEYSEIPELVTDRHRVLQVLINLLGNARHAVMEQPDGERKVKVEAFMSDDGVANIRVIDNGVGIPEENLPKLFSHGFTTKTGGHGFGLHSSILVARELGGNLTCESQGQEKGATFSLQFPSEIPSIATEIETPALPSAAGC